MSAAIRDEIARLRAEAKHFRELAAYKRGVVRSLKDRPVYSRDPVALLKEKDRVTEYVRAAQARDARARELRAQLLPRKGGV